MQATLYTPTSVLNYDPTLGAVIEPSPFEPLPDETLPPSDRGGDYFEPEDSPLRATLDRYVGPGGGEFVWHTHSGEALQPCDMATPHVFYALRMVWNHSVPRTLKVGDGPNYSDVPRWSESYRRAAIDTLSAELAQRDDELDVELRMQLFEMVQKTIAILVLGL